MEVPEHFFILEPKLKDSYKRKKFYLRLHKSLYGLKQAPHEWFEEIDKFLKSIGFSASDADPNLYVRREGNTFLLLYVDDMLLIGTRAKVDAAKKQIMGRWKCKDLGPARLFVGFQIERNRAAKSLKIHQSFYIRKLLQKFGMTDVNSRVLPMKPKAVLHKGEPLDPDQKSLYQQITGSLLYLVNCTRPELCWQVGQLARFMISPSAEHLQVAKEILRYLVGTISIGIIYSGPPKFDIYSDASYGSGEDRTSYLGWVTIDYGGAISWSSQKLKSTALSSMEAEFVAASEASREIAWLKKLWKDIKPSPLSARLLQLRCGHAAIGTYQKRFLKRETEECECGERKQDTTHLVLRCKRWKHQRKKLFEGIKQKGVYISPRLDKKDAKRILTKGELIEHLLLFLKETRIGLLCYEPDTFRHFLTFTIMTRLPHSSPRVLIRTR